MIGPAAFYMRDILFYVYKCVLIGWPRASLCVSVERTKGIKPMMMQKTPSHFHPFKCASSAASAIDAQMYLSSSIASDSDRSENVCARNQTKFTHSI